MKQKSIRSGFDKDPLGYSGLSWFRWCMTQTAAGFAIDPTVTPTREDLNSPILWLSQSQALTEAAAAVIRHQPDYEQFPPTLRAMCDGQYCAVSLMLVGYSLEVCLKGMHVVRKGVKGYLEEEKTLKSHNLQLLAQIVPDLSKKDKAILQALTHFVVWAGRYPDPGARREQNVEEVLALAETHQITAKDLFSLAERVQRYAVHVVA